MKLSGLGDPKYIALETFRKSGEGVKTPVWTVAQDGKLLVWTQGDSWKVKRGAQQSAGAGCQVRHEGQYGRAVGGGRGGVDLG